MSGIAAQRLENDPRWRRLQERPWICGTCGQTHDGIFDLAHDRPDYCPGDLEIRGNAAAASSSHFVSEDFCLLRGETYFVRGVVELPIRGSEDASFGYGVWSSLSQTNFQRYVDGFDDGELDKTENWFGWFSNRLKGYPDTLDLKCKVVPQHDRQRPLFELEPTEHPLALEQRDGITFDRLLDIYALNGHDLRTALAR